MDGLVQKIPNLDITRNIFLYTNGPKKEQTNVLKKIIDAIRADEMAPFLKTFCEEHKVPLDQKLYDELNTKNDAQLKKFDERLEDAEKNLGETDISDVLIEKAQYLAKIGGKENALKAYRVAYEKTVPLGSRIDLVFAKVRIGFFFKDNDVINRNIEKVKSLIEEGGDWDRRNRLKVYEGLFLTSTRDFNGAIDLLLDSLATFTSTEVMPYKDFVKYTVLVGALVLKRTDLKKKVIQAPEILEVIHELPHQGDLVNSLYNCDYAKFFTALAAVEQEMKLDDILAAHYRYYVRELRIIAYAQLLESYRSVSMESMARSFGVSENFIDSDLSKFIAAGRLNAVIDKVAGIIETNRPDAKNAQYQATIKQGDLLLNRIQKLGRVINV